MIRCFGLISRWGTQQLFILNKEKRWNVVAFLSWILLGLPNRLIEATTHWQTYSMGWDREDCIIMYNIKKRRKTLSCHQGSYMLSLEECVCVHFVRRQIFFKHYSKCLTGWILNSFIYIYSKMNIIYASVIKCGDMLLSQYQPLATWHFGSLFGYFDEGRGGWDTASKTMHGIDWTGASASVWAEHLPVSATPEWKRL